jgi:hypothetical protein
LKVLLSFYLSMIRNEWPYIDLGFAPTLQPRMQFQHLAHFSLLCQPLHDNQRIGTSMITNTQSRSKLTFSNFLSDKCKFFWNVSMCSHGPSPTPTMIILNGYLLASSMASFVSHPSTTNYKTCGFI